MKLNKVNEGKKYLIKNIEASKVSKSILSARGVIEDEIIFILRKNKTSVLVEIAGTVFIINGEYLNNIEVVPFE